ncbi:MAG: CRISPR-associated endonuclease Cas1 [Deltaproteobacteria bacterium]|nr:CRISPR-associated endonuclease Cas1 [Deltaproteobacteria bacterium]
MGGTAYIDRKHAELRLDGSAIAVYANGERAGVVPLVPLGRLVLIGDLVVHTALIRRLAEHSVDVVFLSGKLQQCRGRLVGRVHRHARLRLRQYELSSGPFALECARALVVRKLAGQLALLNDAAADRPSERTTLLRAADTIASVAEKVPAAASLESLRGFEGGAAAAYFAALTTLFADSLKFDGRTRRPPRDPVNALLSLTYTLIHHEWVRECELIGFDPLIGFYHQLDYGRESLACDLTEPSRPDVDRWIWEVFRQRRFTARDFSADGERPGCYLKKASRGRYYQGYEEWIASRRPAMRAEVEALARSMLDGEDTIPIGEADAADSL